MEDIVYVIFHYYGNFKCVSGINKTLKGAQNTVINKVKADIEFIETHSTKDGYIDTHLANEYKAELSRFIEEEDIIFRIKSQGLKYVINMGDLGE